MADTTKADTPHLALPLRYIGGRPVVNEQDSWEDVFDSAQAVARYPIGFREDLPQFGTSDLSFASAIIPEQVTGEIEEWEPRTGFYSEWDEVKADLTTIVTVRVGDSSVT